MTERWRDLARASAATGVIGLLVVGVPVLLVQLVGSPVHGPWSAWLQGLRYGQLDPQLLVSALAIVIWIAWFQLLVALVIEVVAAARGVIARRRVTLAVVQPIASRLVSAVLLLSTTFAPRSVPALAAPPVEPLSVAPAEPGVAIPADESRSRRAPRARYEVRRRDTLWGIAERELGDGHRWREIRDLNIGRPQPGGAVLRPGSTMIDVGWTLLLPAGLNRDPDTHPDSPGVDVVKVERGDTLSEIAADHLGSAERWPALYRHNRGQRQPDGGKLRDPDLIRPGWRIDIDVSNDHDDRAQRVRRGSSRGSAEPPASGDGSKDGSTVDDEGADRQASQQAVEAPIRHSAPARGHTADEVDGAPGSRDADDSDTSPDDHAAWTWWAAGGLMSAGVLATLVRQQRIWGRRRRLGDAAPEPDAEAAVHAAGSDGPRQRVALAVRAFAGAYDAMPPIAGVTIDPAGGIALLLEDAAPDELPDGWLRDPADARVAVLPAVVADSALEGRAAVASSAAATLVTLGVGTRSEQLVLLALESCRGVALSGPADIVEATMLAWVLELATSEFAGALDVWLVGFTLAPDTTSGWERIHPVASVPEAVGGIRQLAIGTDEAQPLPLRGDDDWIPQVIVCAPALARTPVRELLAFASAHSDAGVITLVSDEAPPGHWHVAVAPDTVTVTSLQDPVVLSPVRRTSKQEFSAITGMVTRSVDAANATCDVVAIDDAEPSVAMLERLTPQTGPLDPDEPLPADLVVVRLLGPVTVEAPDGETAPAGRSTQAVAYLACHHEGVSPDRLIDALWDGRAVDRQRLAEVLSRARSAIGGADRLPRATGSQGYRVASSVVTDLELLGWNVLRAQREREALQEYLTAALALIRGRPFADVDWTWSLFDGLVSSAAAIVADVATTLATWHLEQSDPMAALRAVEQGQLATPESESLGRMKMRAHYERGELEALEDVMTELRRNADDDLGPDGDDRLHPDTVRLYRRLTSVHASTAGR